MQIDETTLKVFSGSHERCQANPKFLSLFYQKFIISNSEIREKFSNTDMENQKMMLHASLYMIMLATQSNDAASKYLDIVANQHSKSALDIRPELYEIWLETLLETVSIIDPKHNIEVETAWTKVMTYGIDYMNSKYDVDSEN